MENELNFISLTEERPLCGQKVYLRQGDIIITAIYHRGDSGDSFEWVRQAYQNGICLITNPTHFAIII